MFVIKTKFEPLLSKTTKMHSFSQKKIKLNFQASVSEIFAGYKKFSVSLNYIICIIKNISSIRFLLNSIMEINISVIELLAIQCKYVYDGKQ